MSHLFDWSRFLRLAANHFQTNLKKYLISSLVFAGITVLLFILVVSTRKASVDAGQQFLVYFIVIYGGLYVFTGNIFRAYQRPKEDLFRLMQPASGFEKFLLAWLVSFPLYAICANALYFAVRYVVLQYYAFRGYEITGFFDYDRLLNQPEDISLVWLLVMGYVFSHAAAFFGSLVFRKSAVLKIVLTLLLVMFVYWAMNGFLYGVLFDLDIQQAPLLPFMPLFLEDGGTTYRVALPDWSLWLLVLSSAVAGLLWVASYHKLREKEG